MTIKTVMPHDNCHTNITLITDLVSELDMLQDVFYALYCFFKSVCVWLLCEFGVRSDVMTVVRILRICHRWVVYVNVCVNCHEEWLQSNSKNLRQCSPWESIVVYVRLCHTAGWNLQFYSIVHYFCMQNIAQCNSIILYCFQNVA